MLVETKSTLQRKALLNTIDKGQLKALVEITHNLLAGVIPLKPSHKKALQHHKKFIRLLGDPKVGFEKKKRVLQKNNTVVVLLLKSVWSTLKTILTR
jgi:hypothetical protein